MCNVLQSCNGLLLAPVEAKKEEEDEDSLRMQRSRGRRRCSSRTNSSLTKVEDLVFSTSSTPTKKTRSPSRQEEDSLLLTIGSSTIIMQNLITNHSMQVVAQGLVVVASVTVCLVVALVVIYVDVMVVDVVVVEVVVSLVVVFVIDGR